MSSTTVAKKLGVKPGARAYFFGVPAAVIETISVGELNVARKLAGELDYMHAFVKTQKALNRLFPQWRAHLSISGKLWISWPKGNQLNTDLTLTKVIKIGYAHGLVESKTISIDATWSAMKFTHPKHGKQYKNSYGALKIHETVKTPPRVRKRT